MSAAENSMDPALLETLTPEEREAMGFDDMSPEDRAALEAVAGDAAPATTTGDGNDDPDADADDDDDDDEPGDGAPAEGQGVAPAPAAAPAAAPAEQPAAQDDTPADEPMQVYRAELPPDYQERVTAIASRQAEVMDKFNDGEIDIAERDKQLGEINAERENLLLIRSRVEAMEEVNRQNLQREWMRNVNTFMADATKPEMGGVDYRKNPAMAQDLDGFVKYLANNPANEDKSPRWFLDQAHKLVLAQHGIERKAAALQKSPEERLAEARAARKPPTGQVQPNLAQVPGSDGPGDVASEFADVEALEGQELEDAIARMSPDQRRKFLAS